jgi:2-aminoadipate transaminase
MFNAEDFLSSTARNTKASDIRELLKITARPEIISFAGGLPDPALFPVDEYRTATERGLSRYGAKMLQYSPTEGVNEMRDRLLELMRGENLPCPQGVGNILVTTGSQQALELLGLAFLDAGDTVLVEAPSYPGALQAFSLRNPRYEPVATDADGLRIDVLAEKLAKLKREGRSPKFLYTVATFQNPSGVCLSAERRRALLELSERENLLIVEDEPYSKLRFDGEDLPSLRSIAGGSDRVICLRTFSKILAPGLRTGFVVAPDVVISRLTILKQALDLCSPAFSQYVILELLDMGIMESYTARVIEVYRHKMETMAAALSEITLRLGWRWNKPLGGMFIWVDMPEGGIDAPTLLREALNAQVAFVKGDAFYPAEYAHLGKYSFRLNFSQPSPERITAGIARLGAALLVAG